MNLVASHLTEELSELIFKARHAIRLGLSDGLKAKQVVSVLAAAPRFQAEVEVYAKFQNWNLGRLDEWGTILTKGAQVLWDPEVDGNMATIDGVHYSLEGIGARRVDSNGFRFRKAGFFGILEGKLASGQKLARNGGFPSLIIVEQDRGRFPMFLGKDRLPSDLRAGDVLRIAYLSIAGDRTFSGVSPPTEVFLEAVFVERIERHRNGKPLAWTLAPKAIDDLLTGFQMPPLKSRKKGAWLEAAKAKILSDLKKRMVYIDADDERYLYSGIQEKSELNAR